MRANAALRAHPKLERLARRAAGDESIRPVDLWRLANRETHRIDDRVLLFQQALRLAGYRVTRGAVDSVTR